MRTGILRSATLGIGSILLTGWLTALPRAAWGTDADREYLEIALYGWGAMIAGEIDTDQGEASAYIPFSDILDNLNFAAMARARGQFDKLSIVADVEYLDLDSDREQRTVRLGPRGNLEFEASAEVKLRAWVAELSGGYEVLDLRDTLLSPRAELYAGGRYFSIAPEVEVTLGPLGETIHETTAWVDGIVGARINLDLSKTVVMTIQGDVGGFGIGNSSEFAWSQITSLSWEFTDDWVLSLGYKFLDFKLDSGDNTIKMQMRGPLVATSVRF